MIFRLTVSRAGLCLLIIYLLLMFVPYTAESGPGVLALLAPARAGLLGQLNPLGAQASADDLLRRVELAGLYLAACALVLGCVRQLATAHPPGLRVVLAWAGLHGLALLLLTVTFSADLFSYVMYGRIAAIYGANPALSSPAQFAGDPMLANISSWLATPSVYGPLWSMISHGLTLLAEGLGGARVVYLALYKLLGLAAHLGAAALVWRLLGLARPAWQARGTLLYAWNPLALLETANGAHNDALVALLLLLGALLGWRGYWRRALLALLGAGLIKWIAWIVLPGFAALVLATAASRSARLARMAQGLAIAGVTLALAYSAYGQPLRSATYPLTSVATLPENSLTKAIVSLAGKALDRLAPEWVPAAALDLAALREAGVPPAVEARRVWLRTQLTRLGMGLLVLAIAGSAWVVWRQPTPATWLATAFWVLVSALLVLPRFQAWYALWALGLGVASGRRAALGLVGLLTVLAPLHHVTHPQETPLRLLTPVYIFGPLVGYLAWLAWRAWRAPARARAGQG